MKFYHCFYTDLPDQFIEANSDRLIKWVDNWDDKNRFYRRSMIVDMVFVDVIGSAKNDTWPTLKSASQKMTSLWMCKKGDQYSGRYWESLTEDQRSPNRVASIPRRSNTIFSGGTSYGASPVISAIDLARAYRSGLIVSSSSIHRMMMDMEEKPKPPLKRDGIIAGEIAGYRCWRIERGLLRSVYQSDVWKPGEVLEGRELGDWDQRGIHAWKSSGSKEYHDYIRGYLNRHDGDPFTYMFLFGSGAEKETDRPAMVTGTVFLWGDVVEHERGYRAEFARVRSLDWLYPDATMMGREQFVLDELRKTYGLSSVSGHAKEQQQ